MFLTRRAQRYHSTQESATHTHTYIAQSVTPQSKTIAYLFSVNSIFLIPQRNLPNRNKLKNHAVQHPLSTIVNPHFLGHQPSAHNKLYTLCRLPSETTVSRRITKEEGASRYVGTTWYMLTRRMAFKGKAPTAE